MDSSTVGNSVFDLNRIKSETFVRQIDFHHELPSTNSRALELVLQGSFTTPLLVLTELQTAGRGRGSNQWWSGRDALTFSLVTETNYLRQPVSQPSKVSLCAGLAVCETLTNLSLPAHVGLKWPNDVHLDGHKVCGILVEVPPHCDEIAVLGIGINVNNSLSGGPPELQHSAAALIDIVGKPLDLNAVLTQVLKKWEEITELAADDKLQMVERWQTYCVLDGRRVKLNCGSETITGNCRGIDSDGALVLETQNALERFFSGSVIHVE